MKVIGITGGIGCGKTTFTNYLKTKSFEVIDADEIVSKLFADPSIQEQIVSIVGTTDKSQLRKIVFQSDVKRKDLESILHPHVIEVIEAEINQHRSRTTKFLFVSIPLLFEKDLTALFDETVAIVCEEDMQLKRLRERDGNEDRLSLQMIRSQLSNVEKAKKADTVIHNDGSIEGFHRSIESYLQKIRNS
ncbi:MAG: dephospho-CoA kinase [Bdellovibrionota bacterium]